MIKVEVMIKNQIHALLMAEGIEGVKGSVQSKRGRKQVLDALKQCKNGLVAQPLFDMIDRLDENIKSIESQLCSLTKDDKMVELLMGIPGCGEICAWTIRAYTDDINRFSSSKKYVSYAGLAPWVQNSNETIHHGRITKRGPKELRTALVQVVMGLRRMKAKTLTWRLMQRYELMKRSKGSGKSIIATARKMATIIWRMLALNEEFSLEKMVDRKLKEKAESMRQASESPNQTVSCAKEEDSPVEEEKPKKLEFIHIERKNKKKPGVAGVKIKKSA